MPNEQSAPCDTVAIDLQIADLAIHLFHGSPVDVDIVTGVRQPSRHRRIAVLHIRHIDIHDAVQQSQGRQAIRLTISKAMVAAANDVISAWS